MVSWRSLKLHCMSRHLGNSFVTTRLLQSSHAADVSAAIGPTCGVRQGNSGQCLLQQACHTPGTRLCMLHCLSICLLSVHWQSPLPYPTAMLHWHGMAKPITQYSQAHHSIRPSPSLNTVKPSMQYCRAHHSMRPSPSLHISGSVMYKLTMCMAVQGGNNNTYCHDSELNWFNWGQAAQDDSGYARFFRHLVNFRFAITPFHMVLAFWHGRH